MQINKKIINGLLGGGVTILAASFGGIKANEKVQYNQKLNYFGGLRTNLNKVVPSLQGLKNWTIPKWEDDEIWKELYKRQKSVPIPRKQGADIQKKVTNAEGLRDVCYEIIANADKDFAACNSSQGWCEVCLIERDWYNGKYKNIP